MKNWKYNGLLMRAISCYSAVCGFRFPDRLGECACLRACLHGGGGPQVGEVTRLAVVEKWPEFTCKLTTPGYLLVTRRCCVVARHVNRENGGWTKHFGGQCAFPLIICSRCNISVLWLFTFYFFLLWRACKCNMNSTPGRLVTPPWVVYMKKCDPGWQGYPTWQTGQPA